MYNTCILSVLVFLMTVTTMTCSYREKLLSNFGDIVGSLEVDDVLPYLIQDGVFSIDDSEVIRSEASRRRRAFRLMEYLMTKGQPAIGQFCMALKISHEHLWSTLQLSDVVSPCPCGVDPVLSIPRTAGNH